MLARFPSRVPPSLLRRRPSSLLSSACYSSSLSSSSSSSSCFRCCEFGRGFSSSNTNEKEPKHAANKAMNAHVAVAAAVAALLPSAYISLSRDHLLRQADLPEYTRKWPQLWQLTSTELKQNGAKTLFTDYPPYPQSSAAARLLERLTQPHPPSSSPSSSALSSASSSVGYHGSHSAAAYSDADWTDETGDDVDLDDDDEADDLTLSQLDAVEDALVQVEERDFTVRLDRVENSISRLNDKLHNMEVTATPTPTATGKRTAKAASKKTKATKTKAKATVVPRLKTKAKPPKEESEKTPTQSLAQSTADELSQAAGSASEVVVPSAAELAAFMSASPARAQLYHQMSELQQSIRHTISSVALPKPKRGRKAKTVRKAATTVAATSNDTNSVDETENVNESDGVQLDSTKRKRRRKMNRHQYKKRKKLERQKSRTSNKKIHIS